MDQSGFDAFHSAYEAGKPALVTATLIADLETAVSAFLKLTHSRVGNVFLLESVEGGATRGRYSIIGMDPDVIWRAHGDSCEINRQALSDPLAFEPLHEPPLAALRKLLAESAIESDPALPPMAAGVFGYLGYDMVRHMERLAPAKPDPIGVPDAVLIRPTLMAIFDSVRDELILVTPVRPRAGVAARAAWESAQTRLENAIAVLDSPAASCSARSRPASACRRRDFKH